MATPPPSMVICFYPDFSSHIMFAVRNWGYIVSIAFHSVTLFHRQWVLHALSTWLYLGVSMAVGASQLHGDSVKDPYCLNVLWYRFPVPVVVSIWAIFGWGLWYWILWKRRLNLTLFFTGLGLASIISYIVVKAGISLVWEVAVSAIVGLAWAGIFAGAVRIAGHLVWGRLKHSSIARWLSLEEDTWTNPPPAEKDDSGPSCMSPDCWSLCARDSPDDDR